MRRTTVRILGGLLGTILLAAPLLASAQDAGQQPKAPTPDQLPGKQLIVWSETQRPHAMPGSSDEMYRTSGPIQVMSGTILARGGDLFFATATGSAYRIDNVDSQQQLSSFSGKKIRISGSVGSGAAVIHVMAVELR